MGWGITRKFSVLVGKTLSSVRRDGDAIYFETADGETYKQYHCQDCCESVAIEDICGDLEDLVGAPILQAEESTSDTRPSDLPKEEYEPDSQTWTFYRLATIKGSVVIRWYGSSNGYYSESVDFELVG